MTLAHVTAWLGGELVDRLGVGVDDGARLNAPNSLTHPTVEGGESDNEDTSKSVTVETDAQTPAPEAE